MTDKAEVNRQCLACRVVFKYEDEYRKHTPCGTPMTCPKCQAHSGDDWRQCGGVCPMWMSPHYDPNWKPTPKVVSQTQVPYLDTFSSVEIAALADVLWDHRKGLKEECRQKAVDSGGVVEALGRVNDILHSFRAELESRGK